MVADGRMSKEKGVVQAETLCMLCGLASEVNNSSMIIQDGHRLYSRIQGRGTDSMSQQGRVSLTGRNHLERPSGGYNSVEGRDGGRTSPPLGSDPGPWNSTWDGVIAYGGLFLEKLDPPPREDHCW